jgi:hypothetical protein
MPIKAFLLRYDIEGPPFAAQFLAANDFDVYSLKKICQKLGILSSGKKTNLINQIERFLTDYPEMGAQEILYGLIRRNKNWLTFMTGTIDAFPKLNNPVDIIFSGGKSEWYGPIQLDENDDARWYIRPTLIRTWEMDGKPPKPIEREIRWHLFAKVTKETLSFHWRGFYFATDKKHIERASQFPYWKYVPDLIDEFTKLLKLNLKTPNLHNFVLHQLWEKYRLNENIKWTDLRIRAESGGVSLNARSAGISSDVDVDVRGIKHLANTLELSVEKELRLSLDQTEKNRLRERILQTIIRQFGAKSYEFSLESEDTKEKIFKAHIYFGMKEAFPGPDCFPHINLYTSWSDSQEQFSFILNEQKNASSKTKQPSLL